MPNIHMLPYCGQAVQCLWIDRRISLRFIPSPAFCTHFVRKLWVNKKLYARLIPAFFPLKNTFSTDVVCDLYALPTSPTISTTFLNKVLFNNKDEARSYT
jgi:hypothetical protein